MSRRINGSTQAMLDGKGSTWAVCLFCVVVWFLLVAPQTVLADEGEQAFNGWVLSETVVVSMPEGLSDALDLETRSLRTTWEAQHGRGLSDYTWAYDLSLTWTAPPAVLAAGERAPLAWQIENSNANPLILHEHLAWGMYAPDLYWEGLGDADTLPCDHSPAYLGYHDSSVGRACDAVTRAPSTAADRMAIILEGGIYRDRAWQNVMIEYVYVPTILPEAAEPSMTEVALTTVQSSGTLSFASDCGVGRWLSPALLYLAQAPEAVEVI